MREPPTTGQYPDPADSPTTDPLQGFTPDERHQLEDVMPAVYDELRRLAAGWMTRERAGHTLQPTALVNEAYLRMAEQEAARFNEPTHFFIIAARVMRRILIDHARGRNRDKRGGGWARVTLAGIDSKDDTAATADLLDLAEALDRLAQLDDRVARVVELRFFAGLTNEQTAEALDIARSTAAEDWRFARAWLGKELLG